jgi:hypothetical protein
MTFDQYLKFACEFDDATQGEMEIDKIVELLRRYGQEPVWDKNNPGKLDTVYYMMGGLQPWEDVIMQDPQLQARKGMALVQHQNEKIHGLAEESADVEIEGVSLDSYAQMCVKMQADPQNYVAIYKSFGVRDDEHWTAVSQGFQSAMSTDGTGRLSTHYGQLYMKYAPQHEANVIQSVADSIEADRERQAAEERRDAEFAEKAYQMAAGGDHRAIVALARQTFSDLDDDDIDDYVEPVAERLGEEGRWDAAKVILAARFELLQPGGDREEWLADELESLQ